jgi:hypothetical protein
MRDTARNHSPQSPHLPPPDAIRMVSKTTSQALHSRNSPVSSSRRPGMFLQPETDCASWLCPGTHPGDITNDKDKDTLRNRQRHLKGHEKAAATKQRWWISIIASRSLYYGLLRGRVPWFSPPLAMTHGLADRNRCVFLHSPVSPSRPDRISNAAGLKKRIHVSGTVVFFLQFYVRNVCAGALGKARGHQATITCAWCINEIIVALLYKPWAV